MKITISFLLILLIAPCFAGRSWAYEAVVLKSADIKPYNDALKGFQSSCGCSVRTLAVDATNGGSVSDEISRLHPDVVVAIGMDALARVSTVTDLPVIYVMVPGIPFVGQRANVSGVSMYISPSKYLDSMLKLFPRMKRVGLIYEPKSSEAYVKEAMRAAAARGIRLIAKKAGTADAVPSLMDGLKGQIDLFWMLPEAGLLNPATVDSMLLFSFEKKIPIFTFSKKYVDMGAVAALTVDPFGMGAQAGMIAKRLKEGASGQIRVDADVSGLVVNRKVMEKLGIGLNAKTTGRGKNAD